MKSAQLFTVIGRRRLDPMSVSRVADFRLRGEGSNNVEAMLAARDLRWTPYCYDAKSQQVALVACPADVDLAAAPFYYQAQFQHAQRLMLTGGDAFVSLSERQTPPFTTPVMVYSTGRAGTTLVSKMFAGLTRCVSLSEPDLHTCLLESGATSGTATASLLRAGAQLYFQPRDHNATHLVLKFRGMCVELTNVLRLAHPNVVELFLYRDAEAYVTSSMRAFSYVGSPLWSIRWLHRLIATRPILMQVLAAKYPTICRFFPIAAQYSPRELCRLGPVGLLTISWLSMVDRAHQSGLPSLRYENLLRNPRSAFERLLQQCKLPQEDIHHALTAMEQDSQQGSVVARQRTKRFELSAGDRQTIRQVLARHAVVDRPDFELPLAIA